MASISPSSTYLSRSSPPFTTATASLFLRPPPPPPSRRNHFSKMCNPWRARPTYLKDTGCEVYCTQVEVEPEVDEDEACELVKGVELSIGEGVDTIHAHLFKAVKNNNGTGILLLSDVFGFEDSSTRDFAYRVACNGYNVLVPDLFRGDPWSKSRPKDKFEQWMAKQNPDQVAKDISMSKRWLIDEFVAAGVSSKKLGLIGFDFRGSRAIEVLAGDKGACFGAGVAFCGGGVDLSRATEVEVPVLFISGNRGSVSPVGVLGTGRGSRVVVFEGRSDGFAHRPDSPEDDEDAEKAFTLMRNWLYDGLILGK